MQIYSEGYRLTEPGSPVCTVKKRGSNAAQVSKGVVDDKFNSKGLIWGFRCPSRQFYHFFTAIIVINLKKIFL